MMDDPGTINDIAVLRAQIAACRKVAKATVSALWRLTDCTCPECEVEAPGHADGCQTGEAMERYTEMVEEMKS